MKPSFVAGGLLLSCVALVVLSKRVVQGESQDKAFDAMDSFLNASRMSELANARVTVGALGHRAGDLLFGRFELQRLLGTGQDGHGLNVLKRPKVAWPEDNQEITSHFGAPKNNDKPKFIGVGSFGESWLVLDKKEGSPTYQQEVVVKIFLTRVKQKKTSNASAGSGVSSSADSVKFSHVDASELMREQNEHLKKKFDDAFKECEFAQTIQDQLMNNLEMKNLDDLFMKCFEINANPMYVVLSNAGSMELKDYLEKWSPSAEGVKDIMTQILKGLHVLSTLDPPLIHHDLKTENLMVDCLNCPGGLKLTFIDFGGMVEYFPHGSLLKDRDPLCGSYTAHTAPPETSLQHECFRYVGPENASNYDIYSAGNILVELMTGGSAIEFMWHPDITPAANPNADTPERWNAYRRRVIWYKELANRVLKPRDPFQALQSLLLNFGSPSLEKPALWWLKFDQKGACFVRRYLKSMLAETPDDRPTPEMLLAEQECRWLDSPLHLPLRQPSNNTSKIDTTPSVQETSTKPPSTTPAQEASTTPFDQPPSAGDVSTRSPENTPSMPKVPVSKPNDSHDTSTQSDVSSPAYGFGAGFEDAFNEHVRETERQSPTPGWGTRSGTGRYGFEGELASSTISDGSGRGTRDSWGTWDEFSEDVPDEPDGFQPVWSQRNSIHYGSGNSYVFAGSDFDDYAEDEDNTPYGFGDAYDDFEDEEVA